MGGIHRLTAVQVAKATKPGMYADGGGLYLQVSRVGTKSWIYRYQLEKRPREMGLGPTHSVTLAEAREKAAAARKLKVNGQDPIDLRLQQKAEAKAVAARAVSFRTAAERYIASHKAGWRNAKHGDQWTATLETYVYPIIGELPIGDIDTGLVLQVLDAKVPPKGGADPKSAPERFWTSRPETASRVRGRIEVILDWARVRGYRTGENPARWRGHLDKLLPARSRVRRVKHHSALPFPALPAFLPALRAREGVAARALEFAVLTAARTGEVLGARWEEIDLHGKVWTVPAGRMKAGREHRVPLSKRALDLLREIEAAERGDLIFPPELCVQDSTAPCRLEFARLTAAGAGEVREARWDEIDRHANVWTIPAERTGDGRDRRVLLCARAIELLAEVEASRRRGFIFPGAIKDQPLSNMALLETLRRMERGDLTAHGFRSTFRDWAAERTSYPGEVVEMALAHTVKDKVEAAYRRGDLFEKRRRLMDDWSAFCSGAQPHANDEPSDGEASTNGEREKVPG